MAEMYGQVTGGRLFRVHALTVKPERSEDYNERILAHWHPEIEIFCTLRGETRHSIDGQLYLSHPGDVVIANSGSLHKVSPDDRQNLDPSIAIAVVLQVKPDFLREMVPNIDEIRFTPVAEEHNEKLYACFQQLVLFSDHKIAAEQEQRPAFEQLHLMSLVCGILYEILKNRVDDRMGRVPVTHMKNQERIQDALYYVEKHYAEPVTEVQIAERYGFTKEYFARLFKKYTNMTFMEFLSAYRVSKARDELLLTDKSVAEIALACGFPDARGLIHAFKRLYNDTPLQYRKAQQPKRSGG